MFNIYIVWFQNPVTSQAQHHYIFAFHVTVREERSRGSKEKYDRVASFLFCRNGFKRFWEFLSFLAVFNIKLV